MLVGELKKILERVPDDYDIRVVIDIPAVGPTPTVKATCIAKGFDWNKDKLMIWTEPKLRPAGYKMPPKGYKDTNYQ